MSTRTAVLAELAAYILAHTPSRRLRPHPLRVAIDGVDAAGKTSLANELAPLIAAAGRPVIRASVDGFHNPRHIRHQRGPESPTGFYYDSFNYPLVIEKLLQPIGPDGNRQVQTAAHDHHTDSFLNPPTQTAAEDAILLFDGIFSLRPELADHWDLVIFIDVRFEVVLQRAVVRDQEAIGEPAQVIARYQNRYIPGQQIYLSNCHPKEKAAIVLDNNDLENPIIIKHP